MAKISAAEIASRVQKLYNPKDKNRSIIGTGSSLKRSYSEEDCLPSPENHPWRELTGLPGIPWNKIVMTAGRPDSGKSTMAGEFMAEAQRRGVYVILMDSEDKFSAARFQEHFGGNPDDLLTVSTNEILKGAAGVFRYIDTIKAADPDAKIFFVWDSVGGSQSRAHAERQLDSEKHGQPGQDAKENSSVMKTLVAMINKYPNSIAAYLVNQVYAKIGFMQVGDAIPGGAKIEFHSSLIITLKRIKTLTKTKAGRKVKEGIITRATITKNHLSQTATSVHSMDVQVTAKGMQALGDMESNDECQEEEEPA